MAVECVCDASCQEPGLLAEYYRVRNRLGFLHATAPRRILARALSSHLRQMVRDARRPGGGPLAVAQLRAIRDFSLGRWGRRRTRSWPHAGATTPRAGRCTAPSCPPGPCRATTTPPPP